MDNYRSPGVYVKEVPAGSRPIEGVGTAVAAFVGLTEQGPYNQPTLVSNWGEFLRTFGGWTGGYLPLSVFSYFNNGGGAAYIIRVGENGSGTQAAHAGAELTSAVKAGTAVYRIEAKREGGEGAGLSVDVQHNAPERQAEGEGEGESREETFTLTVNQGNRTLESFPNLHTRKDQRNAATVVNRESKLIQLQEVGSASVAERLPSSGRVALSGGAMLPARVTSDDYVGDVSERSGVGGLETLEDVTMVAVPDLMAAYEQGHIDLDGVQVVQQAVIDHCTLMQDRMAILDAPPEHSAQQILDWRREKTNYDSRFAALYWPWVEMFDPGTNQTRLVPPSGAVAGIWARTDTTRGVHKAPANEVVMGATKLGFQLTSVEQGELNRLGINCIRAFSGRGIRVWGARTLSSDSSWRYINVRRLFNYVVSSILAGTQWAVFEPNDLELWQRLNRTVSAFLLGMWRGGALFGATPSEAFYVKCDAETNPPDVIESGQVVIEVGIAPVKPAEFVVFHIAQLPSGGSVS